MITLHEQLPLLRNQRGEVLRYEESWLLDLIRDAAERTGMDDTWFAEHIAEGIAIYLKESFPGTSIDIDELFLKMRRTLTAVGFPHVAGNLQPSMPASRISLEELAEEAGSGFELSFFGLLGEELRTVTRQPVNRIVISDLKRAVSKISGAKRWCRRCDRLASEILEFMSLDVARSAPDDRQVALVVS